MSNPLILKLEHAGPLGNDDRTILQSLSASSHKFEAKKDICLEGERPETVHAVMDGLACRYKTLPDGSRQIVALLLPGDFCDLYVAILGKRDHSIATLASSIIIEIPKHTVKALTTEYPCLTHAFWWATLVDESILREWLTSMGQREARERMAHLFCELLVRLQAVERAAASSFNLSMTQSDLAHLLGLTSVHVNRVLQDLRERKLLVLKGRRVEIPDVPRLMTFCSFDPGYLHLEPRVSHAG